jgi:predicted RNase H-like HicB family nuclease
MGAADQHASQPPRYAMHIAWSETDQVYPVSLPDWMPRLVNGVAVTHGATYEEAARNGQKALQVLIVDALVRGEPLPEPHLIEYDDDRPIEGIPRQNGA